MPVPIKLVVPLTEVQRDLANCHRGLALLMARKVWLGSCRSRDLQDLTQAAMVGLCEAARGFDADRGPTFAAYACKSCYRAALREAKTSGVIRVPACAETDIAHFHAQFVIAWHDRAVASEFLEVIDASDLGVMLAILDPADRIILEAWSGGQTLTTIATGAGTTRHTIHHRINAAIRKIRRQFGNDR